MTQTFSEASKASDFKELTPSENNRVQEIFFDFVAGKIGLDEAERLLMTSIYIVKTQS